MSDDSERGSDANYGEASPAERAATPGSSIALWRSLTHDAAGLQTEGVKIHAPPQRHRCC